MAINAKQVYKVFDFIYFSLPLRSDRGRFSRLLFFSSLSLLLFVFFGCSDGMEREACVCDHGYERSDLCAEIIIIIIIIIIVDLYYAATIIRPCYGSEGGVRKTFIF